MTKNEAADLFGNKTRLAAAVGVTKSAISQWPDVLTQEQRDRVVGAAVRLGKPLAGIRIDAEPAGTPTGPRPADAPASAQP